MLGSLSSFVALAALTLPRTAEVTDIHLRRVWLLFAGLGIYRINSAGSGTITDRADIDRAVRGQIQTIEAGVITER